jgi:hypothetical protein
MAATAEVPLVLAEAYVDGPSTASETGEDPRERIFWKNGIQPSIKI